MQWLKTILRELLGLFVDDGSFALAIVAWLGIAWLVLPRLTAGTAWGGIVLFAGLVLLLAESAWRSSRN